MTRLTRTNGNSEPTPTTATTVLSVTAGSSSTPPMVSASSFFQLLEQRVGEITRIDEERLGVGVLGNPPAEVVGDVDGSPAEPGCAGVVPELVETCTDAALVAGRVRPASRPSPPLRGSGARAA